MDKHQLTKDFVNYVLLFIAFIFLGAMLVLTLGIYGANLLSAVPYFLAPHDSGLSDHIRYVETVGAMFGLVLYIALLGYFAVKKMSKTATPWIFATLIEFALLLLSLVDRSLGSAPYVVSDYSATWLQLVVLVPLIIGYFYLDSRVDAKRSMAKTQKNSK